MRRLIGLAAILVIVVSACASSIDPAGGDDGDGGLETTSVPPSGDADTRQPTVADPAPSDVPGSVTSDDESDPPMTEPPFNEQPPVSEQSSTTVPADSSTDDGAMPPTGQVDVSRYDGPLPDLVAAAAADLVDRLGVSPSQITVVSAESVVWPDGGLGCPQPDMNYTQVLVDGAKIVLSVDGKLFNYHSGGSRAPFLCVSTKSTTGQTPTTLIGGTADQ
jgi:hypothetical protein